MWCILNEIGNVQRLETNSQR